MNFRHMFSFRPAATPVVEVADSVAPGATESPAPADAGNVVALPLGGDERAAPAASQSGAGRPAAPGLLDAPELRAFFADNHFGVGRHDGANYRTREALDQGKAAIASRFRNTLAALHEQRRVAADRMQDALLQTDGVCANTTARLRLALAWHERDMATLREQQALAGDGQGWVLEALNRYQIGFGKGLREALEFELLSR